MTARTVAVAGDASRKRAAAGSGPPTGTPTMTGNLRPDRSGNVTAWHQPHGQAKHHHIACCDRPCSWPPRAEPPHPTSAYLGHGQLRRHGRAPRTQSRRTASCRTAFRQRSETELIVMRGRYGECLLDSRNSYSAIWPPLRELKRLAECSRRNRQQRMIILACG